MSFIIVLAFYSFAHWLRPNFNYNHCMSLILYTFLLFATKDVLFLNLKIVFGMIIRLIFASNRAASTFHCPLFIIISHGVLLRSSRQLYLTDGFYYKWTLNSIQSVYGECLFVIVWDICRCCGKLFFSSSLWFFVPMMYCIREVLYLDLRDAVSCSSADGNDPVRLFLDLRACEYR